MQLKQKQTQAQAQEVVTDEASQRHTADMHFDKRATEEAESMMTSRSSGTNKTQK